MAKKKTAKKTAAKKTAAPAGNRVTRGRLIMAPEAWERLDELAKPGEAWGETIARVLGAKPAE